MAKRIVIAVTAQDIRQVEVMAGLGMTLKHISLILDISTNTLNRWLALEEVREAFDRGRAQGALAITKTAYSQAIDGNTTMLIFFLKTQLGWRDTAEQGHLRGNLLRDEDVEELEPTADGSRPE